MEDINQRLRAANRALNQEEFDEAVALLKGVLRDDPENVKAWWLMASAVDSPEEARDALEQVLELDPDHAEARSMLDQLIEMYPEAAGEKDEMAMLAEAMGTQAEDEAEPVMFDLSDEPAQMDEVEEIEIAEEAEEEAEPNWLAFADESPREVLTDAETRTASPSVFDDVPSAFDQTPEKDVFDDFDFEDDDFFDDVEDEEDFEDFLDEDDTFGFEDGIDAGAAKAKQPAGRRLLLPLLVLALVVVAAVVVAALVLGQSGGAPPTETPPPTDIAGGAVDALSASYADQLTALNEALAGAGYAEASAEFRETAEGPTLVGGFCWTERGGWPQAALAALGTVTNAAQAMRDGGLTGVGVELRLCGGDDVLFARVASLDQATDFYIEQDSTEADFVATWMEP
ncbi:MAG: tetratricopeptide repeat protein [Anaerolineae bacterium]|nr:tetratricopeptide repeat protein [Anaerolineae bacterium]